MNGITWKVKLKTVQCLIFGLLFSLCDGQFQRQRERDFGFSDFPVPQSFQQLRIFTPSRELGNGDNRVRVNQFSHQFFHPVPAPPSNFAQNNPSARRPPPDSGVATDLPSNPRNRNLQNESGSKRQNSGRNLPIDNSLDIRDKSLTRSRPEPVGRKIQPLDSPNVLLGRGKTTESTTTDFTFGTKLEKSTEPLLQTLNKATPANTLNVEKSTFNKEETSSDHQSSDILSEEEEDYYVYYDEEDLPEELRKLLEEGAEEPLVIERVTTQVKSVAKIPSTTLVPSEQPTDFDLEEIPLLEINSKKQQTEKPGLTDESESETSSENFDETDTFEYENEIVSEDQPISSTEDDSKFQSPEEEQKILESFQTIPERDELSTLVLSTTEDDLPVTATDFPVRDILSSPSIRPFRRPFRPNRFRPAPRRFPERGNKFTFIVDENEPGKPNGDKNVVSVATTKSVVSRITDTISIAEITPRPRITWSEITPRPSSDRGSKAIGGQKSEENSINRPNISEDISDKLDKFQSELSDSFFFGGVPPSPPRQSERPKFIYPKSPLEIIKDLKVGPPDDGENNETPVSDTTTIKVVTTTTGSPSSLADILNNQTEKPVVIKSFNKLVDSLETDSLDGLLPHDFKTLSTTTFESPTESSATSELSLIDRLLMKSKNALSGLVPKDFTSDSLEGVLPPEFSLEGTTEIPETMTGVVNVEKHKDENSASFDTLAGLLPPGFKLEDEDIKQDSLDGLLPPEFKIEESTSKKSLTDFEFPGIAEDDISKFLPKGFKLHEKPSKTTPPSHTQSTSEISKSRLVFPTRPGQLGSKTTTSQKPSIQTTTREAIVIKTGWPVRATTEFTGWPTPNTTATPRSTTPFSVPISFVELTTMTTTSRPTTTTLPPLPRVNGTCIDSCKIAASLRVLNGIDWSGELANPLTSEYRNTATFFKVQLDGVYRSSALAQYYRGIDIEGFSPGSVIVDYYVHLALPTSQSSLNAINASDIRTLFHQALNDGFEGLHFGNFTVDPRASSFVVLSENSLAAGSESESDNSLFPSWAIAVIVIGLLSLLLVVSFGVTMMMRRRRVSQVKKAIPLSEEMLNELNKTSQGVDNYALEDPYDLGPLPVDPWNDLSKISRPRPPPARRPASSTGIPNRNLKNFNPGIYDSWKSEWNGQLASYTSNQSNHYAPGSSYSLSRDLLPNNQARNPEVRRPGSSLANRFNMVHDWGRGYTNTALVNNYTSDWVAATGRSSSLGRGFGIEGGWSPSVFQGSNHSSARRTLRRPTDYDNEF